MFRNAPKDPIRHALRGTSRHMRRLVLAKAGEGPLPERAERARFFVGNWHMETRDPQAVTVAERLKRL